MMANWVEEAERLFGSDWRKNEYANLVVSTDEELKKYPRLGLIREGVESLIRKARYPQEREWFEFVKKRLEAVGSNLEKTSEEFDKKIDEIIEGQGGISEKEREWLKRQANPLKIGASLRDCRTLGVLEAWRGLTHQAVADNMVQVISGSFEDKYADEVAKSLNKHCGCKVGGWTRFLRLERSNPCIEKSFEAVDEAGHKIRAVIGTDEGVRAFSICHTEDSKNHVCYTSTEKPEDQYRFVKKMFESWGYKLTGEVTGESCL